MYLGRSAVLVATERADARSGDDCPIFDARLRGFQEFASSSPTSGTLQDIDGELVPTMNTLYEPIESGQEFLGHQLVDEMWAVECLYNN